MSIEDVIQMESDADQQSLDAKKTEENAGNLVLALSKVLEITAKGVGAAELGRKKLADSIKGHEAKVSPDEAHLAKVAVRSFMLDALNDVSDIGGIVGSVITPSVLGVILGFVGLGYHNTVDNDAVAREKERVANATTKLEAEYLEEARVDFLHDTLTRLSTEVTGLQEEITQKKQELMQLQSVADVIAATLKNPELKVEELQKLQQQLSDKQLKLAACKEKYFELRVSLSITLDKFTSICSRMTIPKGYEELMKGIVSAVKDFSGKVLSEEEKKQAKEMMQSRVNEKFLLMEQPGGLYNPGGFVGFKVNREVLEQKGGVKLFLEKLPDELKIVLASTAKPVMLRVKVEGGEGGLAVNSKYEFFYVSRDGSFVAPLGKELGAKMQEAYSFCDPAKDDTTAKCALQNGVKFNPREENAQQEVFKFMATCQVIQGLRGKDREADVAVTTSTPVTIVV